MVKLKVEKWKIRVELWDCDKCTKISKEHIEEIVKRGLNQTQVYYTHIKFRNLKVEKLNKPNPQ